MSLSATSAHKYCTTATGTGLKTTTTTTTTTMTTATAAADTAASATDPRRSPGRFLPAIRFLRNDPSRTSHSQIIQTRQSLASMIGWPHKGLLEGGSVGNRKRIRFFNRCEESKSLGNFLVDVSIQRTDRFTLFTPCSALDESFNSNTKDW